MTRSRQSMTFGDTLSRVRYKNLIYRVFSLTWPSSMQMFWNKRNHLHKKRVHLPQDWFGTPTWPPFHCFGTPIWPTWRHVKTLYIALSWTIPFFRRVEFHIWDAYGKKTTKEKFKTVLSFSSKNEVVAIRNCISRGLKHFISFHFFNFQKFYVLRCYVTR